VEEPVETDVASIGPATREEMRGMVYRAFGGDQFVANLREIHGVGKRDFVTRSGHYGMTFDQCVETIAKELWMNPKKKFFLAEPTLAAAACALIFIPELSGIGLFVAFANLERPWTLTDHWEYAVAYLCNGKYGSADVIRALQYVERSIRSHEKTMTPAELSAELDLDLFERLLDGEGERELRSAAKIKQAETQRAVTALASDWGVYDSFGMAKAAHLLEIKVKGARDLLLPALRAALEKASSSAAASALDSVLREAATLHKEKQWTTGELQELVKLNNSDPFRAYDFKPTFISLFFSDMTPDKTTPRTLTRAQYYDTAEERPFVPFVQ
jgi:hypothetical protein